MTAYVLTKNTRIDELTVAGGYSARAGGDTIDTNGFKFTIDADSRYCLGATTTYSFGNMTVNATKGGQINIDGRYVRLIPYNTGSGTISIGASITVGSATARVIGIISAFNVAPTNTGVATGWIKVTGWNGVSFPTSGTYTQAGFTFTITGPDIAGFIEVIGDDAAGIIANRLGSVNITGAWFDVGTTTGTNTSTYQLPTNGSLQYYSGVQVETSPGSGVYEWYSANSLAAASLVVGVEKARGEICFVTTAGVLRFGHNGTSAQAYCPVAGCKIRVPNLLLGCCTTAARATNAINATLATRYDFTTTGGGVINIDKANLVWYGSFAQSYSVSLTDSAFAEAILISECASPITMNGVAVGLHLGTAQIALTMSLNSSGGTIQNCNLITYTLAASGRYCVSMADCTGFTFSNNILASGNVKGNATTGMFTMTRCKNITFNNTTAIAGGWLMVTCSTIRCNNTIYADTPATTGTTGGIVWDMNAGSNDITCDGLTYGGMSIVQPYTAIMNIGAAGCSKIRLRNIGTYAAPLAGNASNGTANIITFAAGAAAQDVKVQRVYMTLTRTGISTGDNSSKNVIFENVSGDYADAADVAPILEFQRKGIGGTLALTAQTAVYGTHWFDCYTSTTAGRIGVLMNEPTSNTTSQVTLTNGAGFTAAGGLYMPTIGMSATFEIPYYLIGHSAFQNSAGIMAGGTATNYNYNFSIDKNDGSGWSTMTTNNYTATTLATALNALTGINAQLGFKLRLKITTGTANTTAITSFYLLTSSTTTTQAYQYPLDSNYLTLTGLVSGSDVVILQAGTSTIIGQVDQNTPTTYAWQFSGAQSVDIGVLKPGYVPLYIRNLALTANDISIPVSQVADRNYS